MKTTVVPTNEYYHRIIDAPDTGARRALYTEYFLEPWQQMFQMAAQGGASRSDEIRDVALNARGPCNHHRARRRRHARRGCGGHRLVGG